MSLSQGKKTEKSFLTEKSTLWVTLVRLALIMVPYFLSSTPFGLWLHDPSLLSVLIRPHQRLAQLEEARAIQTLASVPLNKFSSVYHANDSIRIPPLLLAMFSPILEVTTIPGIWLSILLLLIDFSIAYLLEQVGIQLLGLRSDIKTSSQSQRPIHEEDIQQQLPESIRPPFSHIFPIYRDSKTSSSRMLSKEGSKSPIIEREPLISMRTLPLLSAQLYYWSPFTAVPACCFGCWQNIPTLFLVLSVYESNRYSSSDGYLSMSSFYLAVATYLEPHYAVYMIPILCLSAGSNFTLPSKTRSTMVKPAAIFVSFFALWFLSLQVASSRLVCPTNYWRVLRSIYGNTWLTTSPNLSLQWYFRMQTFSRFQEYFGAVFAGLPLILIGPFYLRFKNYPAVQLAVWTIVWTIYRPVQVLCDANVAFCFLLFSPRSLARMGYASTISLFCLPVPLILNIVDHWMWLDANNGNANYIFFQCVAHNTFLGIVLGQFVSASTQRDKALRLTQKMELDGKEKYPSN